jgi:hypothetical protein
MTMPAKHDCDNVNQLFIYAGAKHWHYKKLNYYFCLQHLIFTWGVMIFMTPFILSHRASKRGLKLFGQTLQCNVAAIVEETIYSKPYFLTASSSRMTNRENKDSEIKNSINKRIWRKIHDRMKQKR